ncbi:MAG TPA: HAMP domain-containing sensor histidine kinase [Gemmatimonadaceae bacterium]|nr:HAMP domain-containing sensor histidine kinase [Gemmatimonadaceae bacterium]
MSSAAVTRSTPRSRSTVLVALLALTLALAGVLAYEAHDAARSHQATAERALRDYAVFAAWEFLTGARQSVNNAVSAALSPATSVKASSPYELLPPPAVLDGSAAAPLRCDSADAGTVADRALGYFRLDLRNGSLTFAGPEPPPAVRAWLADTVTEHARTVYRPDWSYALVFGGAGGRARAVAYGIKYAEHNAPVAAYGFLTCPSAFGAPVFREVMRRNALLPVSLTGGAPNDSLLVLAVKEHGREIFRSAPATPASLSPFVGEVTMEKFGGLTARVTLRPDAVSRLAIGAPPRSRLLVIFGLLVLTAGLVVVALLQLRREHELARLRADFVSGVSHELRTPLAQILLFAETLSLDRVRSDRERRTAADIIVQEGRRLMHLVDNVLHFARAERGLNRVAPQPTALAPLLEEVAATFRPLAAAAGAGLRTALDERAAAPVDRDALRQVLLNLLDNAVKYGPAGQTVTLGVTSGAGGGGPAGRPVVRLWVEDEGPGIDPADRERIWLPFVRVARDRHAAAGGSGIGLSVVRELVALHGGRAWAEGGAGGRGARFVVELPASEVVSSAERAPRRPDPVAAGQS